MGFITIKKSDDMEGQYTAILHINCGESICGVGKATSDIEISVSDNEYCYFPKPNSARDGAIKLAKTMNLKTPIEVIYPDDTVYVYTDSITKKYIRVKVRCAKCGKEIDYNEPTMFFGGIAYHPVCFKEVEKEHNTTSYRDKFGIDKANLICAECGKQILPSESATLLGSGQAFHPPCFKELIEKIKSF